MTVCGWSLVVDWGWSWGWAADRELAGIELSWSWLNDGAYWALVHFEVNFESVVVDWVRQLELLAD